MNVHEQIRSLLPLAAADALTPEEDRALREHLAGCAACAAEEVAWRSVAEALAAGPPMEAPAALVERTRALMEARLRERRTSDSSLGAVAAVAALGWAASAALWAILRWGFQVDASVPVWLAGSGALSWLTAGVAAVVIARSAPVRPAWRVS